MLKEITTSEQAEELGEVIEKLAVSVGTMREAFSRQQNRMLEDVEKWCLELSEEMAFDATIADELMFGKPLGEREPLLSFQNILTHLQIVDKSLKLLTDALRSQMKEGVLLSDKEMDAVIMLLERQEQVLRTLAEVVRSEEDEGLNAVDRVCSKLSECCRTIATSYETRLVEGLCAPASAPIFLTILDRVQAVVHNEVETLKLLARWFWDHVGGDTGAHGNPLKSAAA
jgi:hypothetical protein